MRDWLDWLAQSLTGRRGRDEANPNAAPEIAIGQPIAQEQGAVSFLRKPAA